MPQLATRSYLFAPKLRATHLIFVFPSHGQVNYQAFLRTEGLRFSDGVVPANNVEDSPLPAWNDMRSNSSAGSDVFLPAGGESVIIEVPLVRNSLFLPALPDPVVATKLPAEDGSGHSSLISSVVNSSFLPNLFCDAKQLWSPSCPPISLIISNFKRNAQHMDYFIPARRVVRKLCFETVAPPFGVVGPSPSLSIEDVQPETPKKRDRKPKLTPAVSSDLHRNPRSNIYKGFKVDLLSGSKKKSSEVKGKVIIDMSESSSNIPALISVEELQKIGKTFYAIPDEEITTDKLEADGQLD